MNDALKNCARAFATLILIVAIVKFVKTEYVKLDVVLTQFVLLSRLASTINVKVSEL